MPDYHIYIHSSEQKASQKTKPMTTQSQGAFIPDFLQDIEQQNQELKDLDSNMFGVASLITFGGVVATTIAAIKTADHIIGNSINAYSKYTGAYQYSMQLSNLRTAISALSLSTQINNLRNNYQRQIEVRNFNIKVDLERSVIANYSANKYRKGV